MSDDERLCPLDHKDGPARSAFGTVLCGGHIKGVSETFVQLAGFSSAADRAVRDRTLSRKVGAPVSGDREKPLPIDDRTTEHKVDTYAKLSSWALLVSEERVVGLPAGPSTKVMGRGEFSEWDDTAEKFAYVRYAAAQTRPLCVFLAVHHEWSCMQTWADDYAGAILALGRRAWALLHPSGNRQFVVGRCLERDEIDGSPCPGEMWARLTPSDPAFEVAADLCCDTCDCTVPSTEWIKYGRRVMAAERETAA